MAKRNSQLTELLVVAQDDYLTIVDTSAGQSKRVSVKNLTGFPDLGWTATGESWSFSSYSSTTNIGVITVPSDATTKYNPGVFVRISQSTGGTKYGRVLSVTTTTISVWFRGYTLNNEAISSPVYSTVARPLGLPVAIAEGNPYEFSVWRNAALSTSASDIVYDTETFDNTDNYNTSNGRFTAPVAGRYQFNWGQIVGHSGDGATYTNIKKNGSEYKRTQEVTGTGVGNMTTGGSAFIDMAAGDYVTISYTTPTTRSFVVGNQAYVWFNGFLASRA